MDYDKKYNDALERARYLYNAAMDAGYMGDCKTLEVLFPELKESDDERIRKRFICFLTNLLDQGGMMADGWDCKECEEYISWLEKQSEKSVDKVEPRFKVGDTVYEVIDGFECTIKSIDETTYYGDTTKFDIKDQDKWELVEKKSADKVETKFNVGDWIVQENIGVYKVVEICNLWYEVIDLEDNHYSIPFVKECVCHLWSIEDAKDGDVLVCDGKYGQEIGIVKKYIGKFGGCDKCFETYCYVDWDGIFRVGEYMGSRHIHPATKEQRDTLFEEMREAGCEWDAEKKE